MYKIIGADGKEYGPIPAEQVRQWIIEGRAEAQTMAVAEGMTEWKPLIAFPEFGLLLAGTAVKAAPGTVAPVRRTNGFALAGMILGIISVVACCCYAGLPFNVPAMVFSIIALVQIHKRPEEYEGTGMAIAGIVLAVLSFMLGIVYGLMTVAGNAMALGQEL